MNMRLQIKGSLVAVLALLVFAAWPAAGSAAPKPGGRVVISSGAGVPLHFNPALVSGSATAIVGTQIFASPLRYDQDWTPQPYLARSWEFSKDGLALTLNLVKDAVFHDGHPVTSADVDFSIRAVQAHHPFKPMFAPVERIDTPDPHTAVIRLSRPHPAVLLSMSPALLPILPKHVYGDGRDLKTHPANLQPVGSGPFQLVKNVPGKYLVLKRHERFFIPGRPYLDEVVIRFDGDPNAQLVYMEHRDAHILPIFLDLEGIERLKGNADLAVTPRGHEGLGALNLLAFNLLRKPLDDQRVRQAIAYAIDPVFVNAFMQRGMSVRATGPISPSSPFYEPKVRLYDLDLKKAGELLDRAGLPLKPGGTRLELNLDYIPLIPSQQRDIAFYLKRQLAKVGIDVRVRSSSSFKEWAERVGNWDFDMTMDTPFNWGDPIIGVHRTYLSSNIRQGVVWSNTQNYRNPQVDDLLDRAGREMDAGRRKKLYSEFQHLLTEELPVVWLNMMPLHTVYDAGLGNPPLSIWGMHSPLDELYWPNPPARAWVPTPALREAQSDLERVGIKAIELLRQMQLHEALDVLENDASGYRELQNSGLHVFGFTSAGKVLFDTSGQMKPGMDIGGLRDAKGNRIVERLSAAAEGQVGRTIEIDGFWPHPKTHRVGRVDAWCGRLTEGDRVCALQWE